MEGLRETGDLPLFSPEGRTYSPPVKQAVVCLRHRALSEGDCGFCGSLQTVPQHLRVLLSSSVRLGKYRRFNRRYFFNRLRKPATGSFAAEMDSALAPPIFSFTKEKQKKENEVNEQWQFTIWKRRWSAGVRDAPLWPPPLI
jgi:hypothetical protein